MKHTTAGPFKDRAEYEKHRKTMEAITKPAAAKPTIQAVKVNRSALYAGALREVGDLIPVYPERPPKGWLTQQDARDLVEGGGAVAATEEEIAAWLAANGEEVAQ